MAIPSNKQQTNGTTTYTDKVMGQLHSGYNSFVLPYAKASDKYLGEFKRRASTYDAALSKYPILKVYIWFMLDIWISSTCDCLWAWADWFGHDPSFAGVLDDDASSTHEDGIDLDWFESLFAVIDDLSNVSWRCHTCLLIHQV